jgi:hypothetical protein
VIRAGEPGARTPTRLPHSPIAWLLQIISSQHTSNHRNLSLWKAPWAGECFWRSSRPPVSRLHDFFSRVVNIWPKCSRRELTWLLSLRFVTGNIFWATIETLHRYGIIILTFFFFFLKKKNYSNYFAHLSFSSCPQPIRNGLGRPLASYCFYCPSLRYTSFLIQRCIFSSFKCSFYRLLWTICFVSLPVSSFSLWSLKPLSHNIDFLDLFLLISNFFFFFAFSCHLFFWIYFFSWFVSVF